MSSPRTANRSTRLAGPKRLAGTGGAGTLHATFPAATLALGLLTLVTAASMGRLFLGSSYLGPVLVAAVTAHAVAYAWRRLSIPITLAFALSAVCVGLVAIWTVLPQTTTFGLPVASTFRSLGSELARAGSDFQMVRAPAPATHGFLIVSVFAVGLAGTIADWLAFRAGATFEAAVPTLALFLFTAALGTADGRVLTVAAYACALLSFVLLRELDGSRRGPWFSSPAKTAKARSRAAMVVTGASLSALSITFASFVGPGIPGARSAALIDWHNLNRLSPNQRTTISPLVSLQAKELQQSRIEMFNVFSPLLTYWRLTSLDNFDGTVWSSDETYKPTSQHLDVNTPPLAHAQSVTQTFTISGLDDVWLPAAYQPVGLRNGPLVVGYNGGSSSIIPSNGTPEHLSYRVVSEVPHFNVDDLGALAAVPHGPQTVQDTKLPDNVPPRIITEAKNVVRHNQTPFGKALALQQYFQSGKFHYDLDVPKGHDDNALYQFLFVTRRGFCEQFAGAYAVMARAVGLPTRVAVGFTPGHVGDDGSLHVYGGDAHAWPEVYFGPQFGWVPFEPTPGRGNPLAVDYTGVSPGQAPGPGAVVTAPTALTPPSSPATPGASGGSTSEVNGPTRLASNVPTGSPASGSITKGWMALAAAGALVAALAFLAPVLKAGSRRRRRRSARGAERVLVAWDEAATALGMAGVARRSSETFAEYASRARSSGLLPDGVSAIATLAEEAALASYSVLNIDANHVEAAVSSCAQVQRTVRNVLPRWRRIAGAAGFSNGFRARARQTLSRGA